jgi:hypothetical protein
VVLWLNSIGGGKSCDSDGLPSTFTLTTKQNKLWNFKANAGSSPEFSDDLLQILRAA